MPTFKVEIGKKKEDGTAKVMILVRHNGGRKRMQTGIVLGPKDFSRNGKIKNQEIIDELDGIVLQYRKKANAMSSRLSSIGVDSLVDLLSFDDTCTLDFIEIFKLYIEENKEKKSIRNYKSALNSFIGFLGKDKLDFQDFGSLLLRRYMEHVGYGRSLSLYVGALRHVHSWAMERYNNEEIGVIPIKFSPFKKVKIPKYVSTRKRALDSDVIRRIAMLPYMEDTGKNGKRCLFNLAKDCFILSFGLIGMNSADLYDAGIYADNTITYFRSKTRDRRSDRAEISIYVQDIMKRLFEKYKDGTGKKVFVFHEMYSSAAIFNRAINKGLKQVGEMVGISDLEFYAARHSWATIARNDLHIDKFTIHEALNHVDKDMQITDIYIKKDFSNINSANRKVLDLVFGKPNSSDNNK